MIQNLLNKKFNYLTIIDGPIIKNKKTYWICRCDCGKIKQIRADQLKSGKTKSCGCFKKANLINNNYKKRVDLTNKKSGKLIALQPTDKRTVDGRVIWKCVCDCGNITYVDTHSFQSGKKQSCGCLISKGENKIYNLLIEANIPFETQKTFTDCRFPDTNYFAKFDFYVDNKYLIEYDGEQHFYYKDNKHTWNTRENFIKVKEHDEFKNKWCKEHNIPLIRISYLQLDTLTIKDLII